MSILSEAALDYVQRGFHVLALHHKRPNTKYHEAWDWENSIHGAPVHGDHPMDGYVGHYDGCSGCEDLASLTAVFDDPTTTGVALLIPLHMLAADVDSEEAATLFMALAGGLPETVAAKTVNGLHLWFVAPGAEQSYWLGKRALLFKGFGGYVAAPPSRHFTAAGEQDGVYTWLQDFDTGMDFLPDAIWKMIQTSHTMDETAQAFKDAAKEDREWIEVVHDEAGRLTLIRRIGIEGLVEAVVKAQAGNRNNMLAWASMTMQEEGVPFAKAYEVLMAAARTAGLQTDESRTTIKSAYRRRRGAA